MRDHVHVGQGSSPRMRGTLYCQRFGRTDHGIIPAYAGNTDTMTPCLSVVGDHPRVCGEHSRSSSMRARRGGSSPRMRGTPPSRHIARSLSGIIPAYAGNTCRPPAHEPQTRDHPRVCGEHCGNMQGDVGPRGIIPAYAGNTLRD